MKKRALIFAIGMGLLLRVMPVQADLIWEPMGDSFYKEHAHACEYVNRTYIANGPDGKVTVYVSPEELDEVNVWEQGKAVHISFVYEAEDGSKWGVYDNGEETESGWVQMEYMALKYDAQAFGEEYASQITEEEVTVGNGTEMTVGFWTYPGSKEKHDVKIGTEVLTFSQVFTDEVGHKWVYVGYFRGLKNYWICVDAPEAAFEELFPDGAPARGIILEGTDKVIVDGTQYMTGTEQQTNTDAESQIPFVASMVAGVVVITGGLLAFLKRSFLAKSNKNS
ncbi:MAG: hypothetical protein IJX63_00605 [Lachnospiraceae bacterium]|nr:hypothetical protein [Lachnospiraceae bacterium]